MEKIQVLAGKLLVPNHLTIPFIEGDGIGPDIWKVTRRVLDSAVSCAYGRERSIEWKEVLAGEKAYRATGEWLPDETLDIIRQHIIAIKGPLTTPIGGGMRSLNVTLRQALDLYACVRPVRWIPGVPSPIKNPDMVDFIIFRENMEDLYAGIEWEAESPAAQKVIAYLKNEFGIQLRTDSGIGIKFISAFGTERLMRKAITYALQQGRKSITLMHKGNIMKFTEGYFKSCGYQLAEAEFRSNIIQESEIDQFSGHIPAGKVVIKDRIADNMFQQILLRPNEYDIIVAPNVNGDYLSDAAVAMVGGLGMAPGANFGDYIAVFEATHGTAPKYAGLNKVNPGSLILSGVMMLEYIGWQKAADLVVGGIEDTIKRGLVTYDLARLIDGAVEISTSEFGDAIIASMEERNN
ncbi:MAG: isocitrate dehydrogenase (NADP(+)) [bacterium]